MSIVLDGMQAASEAAASIVCFPECIIPGYRIGSEATPPTADWLDQAWAEVDRRAAELEIGVVLGTERVMAEGSRISARVTGPQGDLLGFQDKVQLDPSEEGTYVAGDHRRVFHLGDLTFGVVICHEGWRYPETVRWAARNGAQIVFHPHVEILGQSTSLPTRFANPENTFHEKAVLCRAAENTCYFASVNCALPEGTSTTSAFVDPEGQLISYQPYGQEGVLVADLDLSLATGFLANRLKPQRDEPV